MTKPTYLSVTKIPPYFNSFAIMINKNGNY